MSPETVEQDTNRPTRKVGAATAAGAAATLLVFILGQFEVDVSPEAAAAIATLFAFVGGYFKREVA